MGEAQAGGKAEEAEPEADAASGAGEEEGRRQGLKGWGHHTKYWSRCCNCKCGSRTCLQQMRHCQT